MFMNKVWMTDEYGTPTNYRITPQRIQSTFDPMHEKPLNIIFQVLQNFLAENEIDAPFEINKRDFKITHVASKEAVVQLMFYINEYPQPTMKVFARNFSSQCRIEWFIYLVNNIKAVWKDFEAREREKKKTYQRRRGRPG